MNTSDRFRVFSGALADLRKTRKYIAKEITASDDVVECDGLLRIVESIHHAEKCLDEYMKGGGE